MHRILHSHQHTNPLRRSWKISRSKWFLELFADILDQARLDPFVLFSLSKKLSDIYAKDYTSEKSRIIKCYDMSSDCLFNLAMTHHFDARTIFLLLCIFPENQIRKVNNYSFPSLFLVHLLCKSGKLNIFSKHLNV